MCRLCRRGADSGSPSKFSREQRFGTQRKKQRKSSCGKDSAGPFRPARYVPCTGSSAAAAAEVGMTSFMPLIQVLWSV